MTPEREAILRRLAVDREWGGQPFVAELLAELDRLRALPDAGVCGKCRVARVCPVCFGTDGEEE